MSLFPAGKHLLARLACVALPVLAAANAHALPSFARQTGEECAACHIGAYGPQLTPHGIAFKLNGYTDGNGKASLPFSGMVVASLAHTSKDLSAPPTDHTSLNDNALLQEISGFAAGKLSDHVGGFAQVTYSGAEHKVSMDNLDVRYATTLQNNAIVGVSVNNNPGLQDPFNTLPAWRFPYTSTELVPGAAGTILDGGLAQQVVGATAYGLFANHIYAEAGLYKSMSRNVLDKLMNIQPEGKLASAAPYARLAYYRDMHKQAFSAGVVAFNANIQPDPASDLTNKYRDLGVDAAWQFLGTRRHICTISGSYIHEKQTLDASFAAGDSANPTATLNQLNINTSYTFDQTYGLTLGAFRTTGSEDTGLYAPAADTGSNNGKPDTQGYTVQTDWTPWGKESSWGSPWANVRVGLQYTNYTKFNGGSTNYDGSGRDAKDNNTLFGFVWTSF
ncbi:hypothetical protein EV700_0787 [Fluviicoccus keumensis]|uniref:Cytochrome c domain-containing protein n=1 Tax=Fluviicoccus keumensis TaxID=1435465 RepID=A0A4Q7ZB64_9GAMM|nr:hypothetical protein [Fluviicoccus keumensis]RZU47820.1 hypothetical protein EV700_0787 [Fluviicoccus keumensis]